MTPSPLSPQPRRRQVSPLLSHTSCLSGRCHLAISAFQHFALTLSLPIRQGNKKISLLPIRSQKWL
jgi:hypothetical protein